MGLALGVYKNGIVKVGKDFLKVTSVQGVQSFSIQKCEAGGEPLEPPIKITSKESVEVFPEVFICAGLGKHCMARLVMSAPKTINILRVS